MLMFRLSKQRTAFYRFRRKAENIVSKELGMPVALVSFLAKWDEACDNYNEKKSKALISDKVKAKMYKICQLTNSLL